MEVNYDRERAKEILANVLTRDVDATSSDSPFLTSTVQTFEDAILAKTPSSNIHRLFKPNDSNEEWTARIRGLVFVKELPPYQYGRLGNNNSRMILKQGIGLTGLGLEDFDSQMEVIRAIYTKFNDMLPAPCKPLTEREFEEFPAIHCSTRVFTHRKHADGQKDIPFTKAEDPHGRLQKIKGDDFIHGEDNCVEYKKALMEDDRITGVTLSEPGSIGIGDVVEVELSFRWFIDRTTQAHFWVGCQSVTLIDDSTRKNKLKKEESVLQQMIKPRVKRRFALSTIQDAEERVEKRNREDDTRNDKGDFDVSKAIDGVRYMQVD